MQSERTDYLRIELVDIARGVALVAMAIYHFTWDLDFFGYLEPGTSVVGGWRLFARGIASSFLFLVGVSLVLAHGKRVRTRAFAKRLATIAIAAAGITLVTYFATPDAFIFFGILHHITLASILGILMLRLPAILLLALAAAVIAAPHFVYAPVLDHPAFWWMGLSRNVPTTNDYIPIFPWFGAVLIGMAATKIAAVNGLLERLARIQPRRKMPLLATAGRHSLLFYLVHQPVLFSSVWLLAQVIPPDTPDQASLLLQACNAQCAERREEQFCRAYCGCVLEEVAEAGRIEALYDQQPDTETKTWLQNVVIGCDVENNE